jgi:hypothetical protein
MDEEPEENPILSNTESILAINIIEDCIAKLEIIGNTLPVRPVAPNTRGYQSLEERKKTISALFHDIIIKLVIIDLEMMLRKRSRAI